MARPVEMRPRYFEGQYIGAADLAAAVDYARAQQSRHALGAHSWGIALGLTLQETPVPGGAVQVHLTPGYAWDGYGRPIVVPARERLLEERFANYTYDRALDEGGEGRRIAVWLRYRERRTQPPRRGFELCDVDDQNARVHEGFVLEIDPPTPASHRVVVAGRSVDAKQALKTLDPAAPTVEDEAIPHQELPGEDDPARWLILVGHVRWLPLETGGGHFVARKVPDDERETRRHRRYIGVVAESVLAADGVLRLARRGDAVSAHFSPPTDEAAWEETVWISGITRAEGDLRMAGAPIDWRDDAGNDHGRTLAIRRRGDGGGAAGARSLEVVIGPAAQTDNRLAVGPVDGDNLLPRLVVTSGGNVGVGTATPSAKLEVLDGDLLLKAAGEDPGDLIFQRSDGTQKGRVWSKPTAGAALHLASGDNTARLTIAEDGKVGIGTEVPTNQLHVSGATGIRQNHLYLSGDAGQSSLAYNAHRDASNGAWVFPDGTRQAIALLLDDREGHLRMEVKSNATLAGDGWASRLKVDGEHGNVGIGQDGPAVKLHVVGDRIRLENGGKVIDLRADGSAVDLQSESHDLYIRSTGHNLLLNGFTADGMVAVGHRVPVCKLHVAAAPTGTEEGAATAHTALIENTSTGNAGDVLALRVQATLPGLGATSSNNFITFFWGTVPVGRIEGNGGFGVSYEALGADFAEALPQADAAEPIQPGDVVGIAGGAVSKATRGADHIAVVSTHPVVVGNVRPDAPGQPSVKIALLGQTPVKVRGPVRSGMYLVPSGADDGTAVAVAEDDLTAARAALVVARAWETHEGAGVRLIKGAVGWGTRESALAAVLHKLAGAAEPRSTPKRGGHDK